MADTLATALALITLLALYVLGGELLIWLQRREHRAARGGAGVLQRHVVVRACLDRRQPL